MVQSCWGDWQQAKQNSPLSCSSNGIGLFRRHMYTKINTTCSNSHLVIWSGLWRHALGDPSLILCFNKQGALQHERVVRMVDGGPRKHRTVTPQTGVYIQRPVLPLFQTMRCFLNQLRPGFLEPWWSLMQGVIHWTLTAVARYGIAWEFVLLLQIFSAEVFIWWFLIFSYCLLHFLFPNWRIWNTHKCHHNSRLTISIFFGDRCRPNFLALNQLLFSQKSTGVSEIWINISEVIGNFPKHQGDSSPPELSSGVDENISLIETLERRVHR